MVEPWDEANPPRGQTVPMGGVIKTRARESQGEDFSAGRTRRGEGGEQKGSLVSSSAPWSPLLLRTLVFCLWARESLKEKGQELRKDRLMPPHALCFRC